MNKILKTIILLTATNGAFAQTPTEPTVSLPTFKKDTISITAFGAISGGRHLNTESINQAIDKMHGKGGGVVLIPAGVWLSGPITLKSNVNLHLATNALLQFTKDFSSYPLVKTSWEGIPQMRNQSPIWALNQQNIAITGKGVIDGNGDAWRMVKKGKMTETQWKKLLESGGMLNEKGDIWYPSQSSLKGASFKDPGLVQDGKNEQFYQEVKDYLRPNMVLLEKCEGVLLEGVTFQNSAAWNIHPLMSSNLTIRNITVRNPWYSQNGDGLDIESCKNVLVEESTFDVGDDAICIKSGRNEAGRERAMPTENLWVRNCTVYHAHGGFVVGSEMSGGAKNLYVDNCTFIGTDIGLRFKTTRGRGGLVENVYINNIYMKDIPGEAILFDMYYEAKDPIVLSGEHREPPKVEVLPVTEATPQFKNFYIHHVVCDGAAKAVFIRGLPEMHIKNIQLSKLDMVAREGIDIQEASNISFQDVKLQIEDTSKQIAYILNSDHINMHQLEVNNASTFHLQGARSSAIEVQGLKGLKPVVKADFGASENIINIK
ncbi:glycoside hydrolase family 28 protein [Olivibacter sp. CPCC 100613]|uniref:glycoside hydrolase family 28 protein n=1 Tax=Olivibacter sp. CPCC 100613 TaxID=3079931 RepID=UPI002FF73E39